MKRSGKHGFTLVEMSIVLVIIGLVTGGILVGRELIASSEIRGTVSHIDKYKSAYQAFRMKYNCIPGDCINASRFGLTGMNSSTNYANGDGDGLIYSYNDGTNNNATNIAATHKYGESWGSLGHFRGAELIDKMYTNSMAQSTSNLPIPGAFMWFTSLRPMTVPAGYVLPDKAGNYLYISTYPVNGQTFNVANPVLTPAQAFSIDSKIDDGYPMSGSVRASWINYNCPGISGAWGQGVCYNIPATDVNVAVHGSNAVTSASVNASVTPAIYRVDSRPVTGFGIFNQTSIHVSVD